MCHDGYGQTICRSDTTNILEHTEANITASV